MKISKDETRKLPVLSLTHLSWIQYRLLAIETLLLMVLYSVLGLLQLDSTVDEIWRPCYQHVLLLVMYLAIFGAYRPIDATNAVKLFSSYLPSFLAAGTMFLLSTNWLISSNIEYRFEFIFLFMAFFVLNSVRPLLLISREQ